MALVRRDGDPVRFGPGTSVIASDGSLARSERQKGVHYAQANSASVKAFLSHPARARLIRALANNLSIEGAVSCMSPIRLSRLEAAMRTVLEFNEAFNRHDVAGMMQLMSDDCVFENTDPAPDGTVYKGKESVTQFWQDFFRDSPHAHIEIEEIFGLGNRCIMRWNYNWVDAAAKKGHVRGVDIFEVKDGFISEKLSYVKG